MIFLYVTCKDEQEAERIAAHLLEKKVCACVNYHPIKSMYWWKGKIEKDNEYVLIIKTVEKHITAVGQEVRNIHSYEVPCIAQIDVKRGNKLYADWIKECVI